MRYTIQRLARDDSRQLIITLMIYDHPQHVFYTNRSLLPQLPHVPALLPLQLFGTDCLSVNTKSAK